MGPLAAAAAIVGGWPASLALRWINVALGAWLLIAPWALGFPPIGMINSSGIDVLMIVFTMTGRAARDGVGGGWFSLLSSAERESAQ